ncbi:MAG TPA: hypothetical protein VFI42_11335 [Thermomicrobiaceae bacterium]|nr:hypothetical protein [Thermomicrobiaceae bacterium]
MAETHPIRLSQDEIKRQAKKYFEGEQGLRLVRDELESLRFAGDKGFVQIDIEPDTNNQCRVTFEHDGYEPELHEFRRRLAKQATAETSAG